MDKLYEAGADYDQMIYSPAQLPGVLDLAVRIACARPGVTHLTVRNDIQVADADADVDPWQHVARASPPRTAPILDGRANPAISMEKPPSPA